MPNDNPIDILAEMLGIHHISDAQDTQAPVAPQQEKTVVAGKYCNRCEDGMKSIQVVMNLGSSRNLYYCKNNKCERFGLLTVVAKTTKLV